MLILVLRPRAGGPLLGVDPPRTLLTFPSAARVPHYFDHALDQATPLIPILYAAIVRGAALAAPLPLLPSPPLTGELDPMLSLELISSTEESTMARSLALI